MRLLANCLVTMLIQRSAMYLETKRRKLLAVSKEKALWNKKKTTKKIIKLVLTCQACADELLVET